MLLLLAIKGQRESPLVHRSTTSSQTNNIIITFRQLAQCLVAFFLEKRDNLFPWRKEGTSFLCYFHPTNEEEELAAAAAFFFFVSFPPPLFCSTLGWAWGQVISAAVEHSRIVGYLEHSFNTVILTHNIQWYIYTYYIITVVLRLQSSDLISPERLPAVPGAPSEVGQNRGGDKGGGGAPTCAGAVPVGGGGAGEGQEEDGQPLRGHAASAPGGDEEGGEGKEIFFLRRDLERNIWQRKCFIGRLKFKS